MKTNTNQSHNLDTNKASMPDKKRLENSGIRVPDEYFDTLSPRIDDRIIKQKAKTFSGEFTPTIRKPYIWAPLLAASLVAILFVVTELRTKTSITVPPNELAEIQMAYDGSYAEEALMAESNLIDSEIENVDIEFTTISFVNNDEQLTDEQVSEYLKEQEIDNTLLTEY